MLKALFILQIYIVLSWLSVYVEKRLKVQMEIWELANIFVFKWKYVEDFTLKHLLRFEICAREMWKVC